MNQGSIQRVALHLKDGRILSFQEATVDIRLRVIEAESRERDGLIRHVFPFESLMEIRMTLIEPTRETRRKDNGSTVSQKEKDNDSTATPEEVTT